MRLGLRSGLLAASALALVWSGSAAATDVLMPGKITIIKDTKLFKVVAKPSAGSFTLPAPGGGGDPLVGGGSVSVFDTGGSGILNDTLSGGAWSGLGNPAGSKGYKYKNTSAPSGGAVKIIIVKGPVVKILAKDDGTLNGPVSGTVGIVLSTGTNPDHYCAEFGGTDVKNDPGLVKRKDAPAPGSCPSPGGGGPCCNNDAFYNFTVGTSSGDCGDIIDASNVTVANINCGGLYTGGGGNSVPLPYSVPDKGSPVTAITTCIGSVATIGPTTSSATGSINNCTASGCRFGAPLAVPNPASTPTSVCVLNSFAASPAVSGTVDCSNGTTNMAIPLSAVIYLTGDTATDPGATIPGIQSCPLCSGGTCLGGPNDGLACIAGTSAINASYPTSNDCPPDPMLNIGTLPIAFNVTTGTVTWTGTFATNDTGSTAGVQSRVFSGFCRDADSTGAFQQPFQECWKNGAAVGSACSGTFETCEQRTNGAFGPAGGANRTIRAIGNAMSIIGGPSPAALVGIFSIPPTFDPTVDASGDLPGPGTVALPTTAQTCATAAACP